MVDIKYKMNWVPQAKELRDRLTAKENVGIASKIDEDTDDDFYQNMYEALSKYFSSDEDADKVLIPEETDRDAISTEVIKSYDDIMRYYGKTGMLSREAVDVELDKVLGDPRMLEIPTKTFDDTEEILSTEEVLSVEEVSDIASDAIDSTSDADEVQPTDGKAFEIPKYQVFEDPNDMSDLEILARTIHAEAGGESYEGKIAVGAVIANRAAAERFGDGIKGVILKKGQFSPWNSWTGYAKGEQGKEMLELRASKDSYKAANDILTSNYTDKTDGATHYLNPDVSTPFWLDDMKNRKRGTVKIGDHLFGNADNNKKYNGKNWISENN